MVVAAWPPRDWSWPLGVPWCMVAVVWIGALGAWWVSLDVGVRVCVPLVWAPFGVVGWPLFRAGRFVLADDAALYADGICGAMLAWAVGFGYWPCVRRLCGGLGRGAWRCGRV